ncbi:MAG: hypothetical protein H7Z14_04920 [Anaerolineae bacterium]|nr:hypothetical protein [Phycisphaerae bacterium]
MRVFRAAVVSISPLLLISTTEVSRAQQPPADGYHITTASLVGGVYETGPLKTRHATIYKLTEAGTSAGISQRYAADGSSLGQDVWLAKSGQMGVAINPSGGVYDRIMPNGILRSAQIFGLSGTGAMLGDVARFAADGTGTGRQAWLHPVAGNTVVLGLSGAGYSYMSNGAVFVRSTPSSLSDNGLATGMSTRYASSGVELGQDAGSPTRREIPH